MFTGVDMARPPFCSLTEKAKAKPTQSFAKRPVVKGKRIFADKCKHGRTDGTTIRAGIMRTHCLFEE